MYVPAEGKESRLIKVTYGDELLHCDGGSRDLSWCQRWSATVQHLDHHYTLPGGSILNTMFTCCVMSVGICLWSPTIQSKS